MKYYFELQFQRLRRFTSENLLNFLFIGVVALVGFLFFSFLIFGKVKFAAVIYSIIGLSFLQLLGTKKRNDFLKLVYPKKQHQLIRLIENLLAILPFVLFLVYKGFIIHSIGLILLASLLSFYKKSNLISLYFPTPFFKHPFEFTAGFRMKFWLIGMSYVLTIISVNVGNFNLGVFAFLVSIFTVVSFYSKPENEFFVWSYSITPTQFLNRKIKTASLYSTYLFLPVIATLMVSNPGNWHLMLVMYVIGVLFVIVSLLGKYAYYPSELNFISGFAIGFCIIFPPLLLVLIPIFYNKSKHKLNSYLNDHG